MDSRAMMRRARRRLIFQRLGFRRLIQCENLQRDDRPRAGDYFQRDRGFVRTLVFGPLNPEPHVTSGNNPFPARPKGDDDIGQFLINCFDSGEGNNNVRSARAWSLA